jgi:L-threonylcarbamoyladenylate synthase
MAARQGRNACAPIGDNTRVTRPNLEAIVGAAAVLHAGGLVGFPTETVYGLGADAASPGALRRLFAVKGRPADHPVIVHIAAGDQLDRWAVDVPPAARLLAATFWPGPLTLILRRARHVADEVTGGRETVGVRTPDSPVALALLRAFDGGIAAPSANRFGQVSPTTAAAVRAELGDEVDIVLDGGPCRIGVESTIVDCTVDAPTIVRLGAIDADAVGRILGQAVRYAADGAVAAPGTLASHYAPRARVEVIEGDALAATARVYCARGCRVGVIAPKTADAARDGIDEIDGIAGIAGVDVLAAPADADEYARVLYERLRDADRRDLDVLLVVAPAEAGIGAAVADRLRRAAGPRR